MFCKNYYFKAIFRSITTNDNSTLEIDFLVEANSRALPLEIKAGENFKTGKLISYCEKFKPEYSIVTSLREYNESGNRIYIPLCYKSV